MNGFLSYKGYSGSVSYSAEDEVFFGKVEFIRDLVSYEGNSAKEIKQGFEEAVDDYLKMCQEQGKTPDLPFKGSFNVRTGSDLHRKIMLLAKSRGENLNQVVIQAIEAFVEKNS